MVRSLAKKLPAKSKLRKHLDFVTLIGKHGKSAKQRQRLLAIACPGEIDACAELFLNVLKGNLKLPAKLLKRLEKKKETIRKIADRKTSRRQKKLLLGTQTGGFLQFLLPALAPLAVKAVKGIFGL